MIKRVSHDQRGLSNPLIIPLILILLAFFGALGFGFWAYSERTNYKENVDEIVATKVEVAQKETATAKDTEFIQREKQPLKDYNGPSFYGNISIKYPKTWSAYVDETGTSSPIDGYFYPSFVPGIKSDTSFAFRLQVSDKTFAEEIRGYDNSVEKGEAKAKPYKPVNVENVVGSRIQGVLENNKSGIIILLPLRDKTIKLWTESDQYFEDFEKNILANFKFTP